MDNQNKSIVFRWLIPTAVMMIVVIAMLFNFSVKSSREAEESVFRTLGTSAASYGEEFLFALEGVEKAARPVAVLLGREGTDDKARVAELVGIAADCSDAYKALWCDRNGRGIDWQGTEMSVADAAYFDTLRLPETSYIYTEEEEPAFIVVERVAGEKAQGYLLLYWPAAGFADMLSQSSYDSAAFLAVIDAEGKIMGVSGAETSSCLKTGNLLEAAEGENAEAVKALRRRMSAGTSGSFDIAVGRQRHVLVCAPLGVNQWNLALGVSRAYVDRQINFQRRSTKRVITSLIVVICVFIGSVMIINIAARIRSNEEKKELGDKADTDLLTGLYNKLATERKIKDYMAQNPQSQSMLFLLDVDNFKKINDTMGHAFGDEVLRSLGQQIGAIFRASDIIGRIGGDEFMIFLKGISDEEAILKEAGKVETFFKGFQAGEYVKYAATASIGVAIFPQEGADFETLYKAADQGLYKAKKRGKNQLAFYSDRGASADEEEREE